MTNICNCAIACLGAWTSRWETGETIPNSGSSEHEGIVISDLVAAVYENSAKQAAAATKKYLGGDRAKMTKRERALFVQEAVRHYAHPPHHEADADESFSSWYSAEDAAFILALAAAALAEVASRAEADTHGVLPRGATADQ